MERERAMENNIDDWIDENLNEMIPSYTFHAFHDEPKMLADFFSPHTFKTEVEDLASIDLDSLFPDEELEDLFPDDQLDKAECFEESDDNDNICYGEVAETSTPLKKYFNPKKTGVYIEDYEDDNILYGETAENAFVPLKKYLYQNCKWTGCDEECAKTHSADIPSDPFSDISLDNTNLVVPSLFFGVEDSSCDEDSGITDSGSVQPYTPDSDHCYSQRIYPCVTTYNPVTIESNRTTIAQDSVDSDSASETSDDEVDVVTVTEECVRPTQRYVRKAYRAPRGRYISRKNTRTRNVSAASTVKAAASALKRSCYQTRIPAAKRRKLVNSVETSPASSLPSSGVSSLCGSDIEDYEKRSTHNDSERKRREAQRTALQMLRVCIPTLQTNVKAPKVLILNTATNLVKRLEREMQEQKEQKRTELKRRKCLQDRLKQLISGY